MVSKYIPRNTRGTFEGDSCICECQTYRLSLACMDYMVGDYGEILVLDWGIARVRSLYKPNSSWVQIKASESVLKHKREAIAGTPRYMAPEQIHQKPI